MTRKLFDGAHQSRVDVNTAARVIGYASSTGGAAASAIGTLRQFGLVDGLRGDVAVSELAMRILQPMNDTEYSDALWEAAAKPELFKKILAQFGGKLPSSDEPIRAYLIRQEGFSSGGADDIIASLKGTLHTLPPPPVITSAEEAMPVPAFELAPLNSRNPQSASLTHHPAADSGLILLPLGPNCRAEIRFVGEVTSTSYERLIRHLQLLSETLGEDE